jgi:hypothetical protein
MAMRGKQGGGHSHHHVGSAHQHLHHSRSHISKSTPAKDKRSGTRRVLPQPPAPSSTSHRPTRPVSPAVCPVAVRPPPPSLLPNSNGMQNNRPQVSLDELCLGEVSDDDLFTSPKPRRRKHGGTPSDGSGSPPSPHPPSPRRRTHSTNSPRQDGR